MGISIYCCGCGKEVPAILVTGNDIYPHREDLSMYKFYRCHDCGNYVGCHPNTTKPLGVIPTRLIREARSHIHSKLDKIWKMGLINRGELYRRMAKLLGYEYHTANLMSLEECRKVYKIIVDREWMDVA